ncbi:MAG: hypothetical protein IPH51_20530 [Rubrivivax sp.]|nr:hypothetical protein [Rubrivivax sp.]
MRELTLRWRCHQDVRSVIAQLNPVLRGWGSTSKRATRPITSSTWMPTSEAAAQPARQASGRSLRPGQAQHWDREYFESLGLHRLRGTIRYPGKPPGKGRTA